MGYSAIDCSQPGTGWSCARCVSLAELSILTAALCGALIWVIWDSSGRKRVLSYQQIILAVGVLDMVSGFIYWGYMTNEELVFTILYLKQVQLVVICYVYSDAALRLLGRIDLERFLWLAIGIVWALFTGVFILSLTGVTNVQNECADITFLLMSSSAFAVSLLFGLLCVFSTRLVSRQKMSDRFREKKKAELWILAAWFIASNAAQFTWDLTFKILSEEPGNPACASYVDTLPIAANAVIFFFKIFTTLFPVWAELWAFRYAISSFQRYHRERSSRRSTGHTASQFSTDETSHLLEIQDTYTLRDVERERAAKQPEPINYRSSAVYYQQNGSPNQPFAVNTVGSL